MKQKRQASMREDGPEEIAKCLSCPKKECNNCIRWNPEQKHKGKAVVSFGNGEEKHYISIAEAARELLTSSSAIQQAIRLGGRCQGLYWRFEDEI